MVEARSLPAPGRTSGPGVASVAPGRHRWRGLALDVPLGLVALVPVATYCWVAFHRIGYRFELEWMEGGAVEVVRRVALGQGIYVQPSLHFVPWPYTPLYWWLSAGVAHLTGIGFFPLRLVSLVASLAVFVVLAWLVRAETGRWAPGLVAAGIYAATYRLAGAWFDIGRIDSLFLLLLLLAVAAARRTAGWWGGVGVGGLIFLAFFTKQSAIIAVAPLVAYLLATRWRMALAAIGTLAGLIAASTVGMDAATGGWYRYYVFGELTHQGVVTAEWAQFWSQDIRPLWPVLVVAVVGAAVWALSRTPPHLRWLGHRGSGGSGGLLAERCWGPPGFYCAVAIGFGGASWASRLHSGGYANVLMPAYAGIALLAGLGYGAMSQRRAWAGPRAGPGAGPGAGRPWGALAGLGAAGLVVAQLALVRYPIAAQIPTTADAHAGARLMAEIKALPGQVVVLVHPWYGTLAGKGNFADVEALHDVLRAGPSKARADLRANLAVALESPRIGAVILDSPGNEEGIRSDLLSHFRQVPMTWHPGNAFYPVVGDLEARPGLLFVRRGLPAKGPGR